MIRYCCAFVLTGGVLAGSGCVFSTRAPSAPTAVQGLITPEEIVASSAATAYELIAELHPDWLGDRCEVYIDRFGDRGLGAVKGDMKLLWDIPVDMIAEIRYGSEYHEKNFVRRVAVIDVVTRSDASRD